MNIFSRAKNLLNINKLYKLITKAYANPLVLTEQKYWIDLFKTALSIKEIQLMLAGYKTYIIVALSAAVQVAFMLGYIDAAMRENLMMLLGTGAVGTVAAKLNRIGNR